MRAFDMKWFLMMAILALTPRVAAGPCEFGFLGAFWDPQKMGEFEKKYKPHQADYVAWVNYHAKNLHYDYVQKNILKPLGINASCKLSGFPKSAMMYTGPNDKSGVLTEDAKGQGCAAGGWVMTAAEMAKFCLGSRRCCSTWRRPIAC